ncbi:MAG: hypothetical protein WCV80_03970 [Candidatus Paceibacterota bacterium]
MFNPLSLMRFKKDPQNPETIREFLKQIGKLSSEERAYIKSMVGTHLKQKVSPKDLERGFEGFEKNLEKDFTPEEITKLKQELLSFFS